MLSPAQIESQARRRYSDFLRAVVTGEPFFPLEIRFGRPKPSDDYLALRREVEALRAGAARGYTIEWESRTTRRYGTQTLPARLLISDEADFLRLIDKQAEVARFRQAATAIAERFPPLRPWLAERPQALLAHLDDWPELLAVCDFWQRHPRPALYARELPVAVHTKFVEAHQPILTEWLERLLPLAAIHPHEKQFERRFGLRYDEPLLRLRLLDPALRAALAWPAADLSLRLSDAAALPLAGRPVVVVENRMTFLTLPPLADGVAIWGAGFQVGLLRELAWLHHCPLWYWGDLDTHGFAILSHLRATFPAAQSLLMDAATLDAFRAFVVPGAPGAAAQLPHLRRSEAALYAQLLAHNQRLEQEKIPHPVVQRALATVAPPPAAPA